MPTLFACIYVFMLCLIGQVAISEVIPARVKWIVAVIGCGIISVTTIINYFYFSKKY
jgi:hypothetical protein